MSGVLHFTQMWSFGGDSFADLTKILNRVDANLVDVLTCYSFRNAFRVPHMKLIQFLFQHLMQLTDMALGNLDEDGNTYPRQLQQCAMFCLVTPAGQFTSQLTACRPFLQKLNRYLTSQEPLTNDQITRFCAILEFIVHGSNGFVLIHFPDRNNLLGKLLKYLKYVSAYNLLHFLSYSGLQIVSDYLIQVDAMRILQQHLGNDSLVNERLFILMSNLVCIAKARSKLTEPFTSPNAIESLLKYCFCAHEKVAAAALRLLTCLCNHFYETGTDSALIRQIGEHVDEFCEYVQSGEHFTKSRSFALLILIRTVAFTREMEVDRVLNLLPGLLRQVVEYPAFTAVHGAFYELLKVGVTRRPDIVVQLKLKELIMDLYSKRDNLTANYWGFLHRITGLIVRWKVFVSYDVEGWDDFVENVYHKDEQTYLSHYGGALPGSSLSFESAFPSIKSSGGQSGGQILSKPQFSTVHLNQTSPSKKEDSKSEEESDYEDTLAEPPEIQGDEVKWSFSTLIAQDRIKTKVELDLKAVFVLENPVDVITFSPNAEIVAFACGNDLEVYRNNQYQALLVKTCFKTRISAMSFMSDNSTLVVICENDSKIVYYDVEAGKIAKTVDFEPCDSAAFSVDCTKIACNKDGQTSIYNLENLERIAWFNYDKKIPMFSVFSPNAKYVATAYVGGHAQVYSVDRKTSKFQILCHDKEITSMAISDAGTRFATSSNDSTVRLWSIYSDSVQWQTLKGHSKMVNSISLDATQKWLISGSKDSTFNITDVEMNEMVYSVTAHIGSVTCVACDPTRSLFATASDDQLVKIWGFATTPVK